MKKTNSKNLILIIDAMFYVLPILISTSVAFALPFDIHSIDDNYHSIYMGVVGAIMGYSFTAGFFLIALPRNNNYLQYIDKNNFLFSYALVIFLSSVYACLTIIFQIMLQQKMFNVNVLFILNNIFLLATLFQFIYSLIILMRVIYLYNKSK